MALPHEATPVILPVVPLSVVQLQDQPGKSSEAFPPPPKLKLCFWQTGSTLSNDIGNPRKAFHVVLEVHGLYAQGICPIQLMEGPLLFLPFLPTANTISVRNPHCLCPSPFFIPSAGAQSSQAFTSASW